MSEKKKGKHRKIRFKKLKKAPPGSAPGMIAVAEDAIKPVIRITSYNETELNTLEINTVVQLNEQLLTPIKFLYLLMEF